MSQIKNVLPANERDFLTVHETAQELGCGDSTIREMIQDGRMPAVSLGRVFRVPRAVLTALATEAASKVTHRDPPLD